MSKVIAMVLIFFWISFGFVISIFNANLDIGYNGLIKDFQMNTNPSLTEYAHLIWSSVLFFVKSMTLTLPNCPIYLTLFIIMLQLMSAMVVIWMLLESLSTLLNGIGGLISKIGGFGGI